MGSQTPAESPLSSLTFQSPDLVMSWISQHPSSAGPAEPGWRQAAEKTEGQAENE